jgi:hypothetical protein
MVYRSTMPGFAGTVTDHFEGRSADSRDGAEAFFGAVAIQSRCPQGQVNAARGELDIRMARVFGELRVTSGRSE